MGRSGAPGGEAASDVAAARTRQWSGADKCDVLYRRTDSARGRGDFALDDKASQIFEPPYSQRRAFGGCCKAQMKPTCFGMLPLVYIELFVSVRVASIRDESLLLLAGA